MKNPRVRAYECLTLIASAGVLTLSGVAIAQDPGPGDPGWEYGRLNCGPLADPQILTLADCQDCCTDAEEQQVPVPPAGWLAECLAYCDIVVWENWGE